MTQILHLDYARCKPFDYSQDKAPFFYSNQEASRGIKRGIGPGHEASKITRFEAETVRRYRKAKEDSGL